MLSSLQTVDYDYEDSKVLPDRVNISMLAGLHHKGDSLVDVQVGLVMQAPQIKGQCHKIKIAYCLRFGLPGTAWLMYLKPL